MKPVYLPFTYVTETQIKKIQSLFEDVCVYIPHVCVKSGHDRKTDIPGYMDVKTVSTKMDQEIYHFCREYMDLGNLHGKRSLDFLKASTNTIPFWNEFSQDRIRSEIRQGDVKQRSRDPLFDALAFLKMAHEFDRSHFDIEQKLGDLDVSRKKMIQNLSQDPVYDVSEDIQMPEISDTQAAGFSPGMYKTHQRLMSWNLMYEHEISMSPETEETFFVTDSRHVFEQVLGDSCICEKPVISGRFKPSEDLSVLLQDSLDKGDFISLEPLISSFREAGKLSPVFLEAALLNIKHESFMFGKSGKPMLICLMASDLI